MQMKMSSRERVLTAINHQEPDRVPTALWGSYYTLQDQTYFNMLEHLNLGEPLPPFRRLKNRNSNYLDDRILDYLETDTRYVWLGFDDLVGPYPDTGLDAWGVRWQRFGPYMGAVGYPLADASIDDLESYPWPDVEKLIRIDECREHLKTLQNDGRYAIVARAVTSYGPFEQAQVMRGREKFLMDTVESPDFAQLLIQKVTIIIKRLTEIYLEIVGKAVDIIEIPGDDYGGTNNLLISPRSFDRCVKPALGEIVGLIKSYRSDIKVAFHSDGAIVRLLPTFIELGIDIFHPLEPLTANDHDAIKSEYGNQLTFMGAIDIKTALPGSINDVENEVKQRIQKLGRGGGYILAPANHLQTDVPSENIVALYRFAKTYGKYPISF
jgi:uroporphyrinogen decarboxylase